MAPRLRGREDEPGSLYWASTLLLTDWGEGDSVRRSGFLALSCDPEHGVSIYHYATSSRSGAPAMTQDWLVPSSRRNSSNSKIDSTP